jgi:hypothetical protein
MSGGAMDGLLNSDRKRKEKKFTTKTGAKEGFIVRTIKKLFKGEEKEKRLELIDLYLEIKRNKDKEWLDLFLRWMKRSTTPSNAYDLFL